MASSSESSLPPSHLIQPASGGSSPSSSLAPLAARTNRVAQPVIQPRTLPYGKAQQRCDSQRYTVLLWTFLIGLIFPVAFLVGFVVYRKLGLHRTPDPTDKKVIGHKMVESIREMIASSDFEWDFLNPITTMLETEQGGRFGCLALKQEAEKKRLNGSLWQPLSHTFREFVFAKLGADISRSSWHIRLTRQTETLEVDRNIHQLEGEQQTVAKRRALNKLHQELKAEFEKVLGPDLSALADLYALQVMFVCSQATPMFKGSPLSFFNGLLLANARAEREPEMLEKSAQVRAASTDAANIEMSISEGSPEGGSKLTLRFTEFDLFGIRDDFLFEKWKKITVFTIDMKTFEVQANYILEPDLNNKGDPNLVIPQYNREVSVAPDKGGLREVCLQGWKVLKAEHPAVLGSLTLGFD